MNSPLPFTVVTQQFIALREQANDEWQAMKAVAVGGKPVLSASELMKTGRLAEKAPLASALRKFVKALPDEQLYALLALIYAGRDRVADPVSYWRSSIRATVKSRSAALEVVLEKEPAATYLRNAVESLPPAVELDALPRLISGQE
jgi:hypothetical protein